ncbi:acyl-homoserine-lactone synthase [Cognatishimia sp. MH4019]|uniref:acyl-homoserine-lactone synthase n=1 Tax=Cognatishimia sp. MH4019 TaxID=2854030 RepID=UPI001CD264EB|nr:acyl-homoserine-lactone synthase [Cognatishimia sp. MH4019]
MKNITFDLSDMHLHGPAFFQFLKLRKRFFVDDLGWDIPHDDRVEMDQYDNPSAHYSLVIRDGRVIGGARAMPTTAVWGPHSYMLRDAAKGMLADIPGDVMDADLATPRIWEITRFVVDDALCAAERSRCLTLILDGLVCIAKKRGGVELMSLSPLPMVRALRQLGYPAKRVGQPHVDTGDGRRYAVISMPAKRLPGMIAKERIQAWASEPLPFENRGHAMSLIAAE